MRGSTNFKKLERVKFNEQMERMKTIPLMLVVAPMGFGKSTVVRDYMQQNIENYIWIPLGQEKVSDEWVWNRINKEIFSINEELCKQLVQMELPRCNDTGRQKIDNFLTLIRKELGGKNFYMVLDDYQACNGPDMNYLLTRLAYEDIPGVHIILIGRTYMDIPFEEMMLKGYCSVISQKEFMLVKEETEELFRINGIELDEGQLVHVYEYTDGWIAAVSLLLLDYQRTGNLQFTGTINRLLREAIYNKLPEKDKELLRRMFLFAEFSIQEMESMTGQQVSYERMEMLMERIGLIHYDSKKRTYMVHSLLRAVIQEELEQSEADVSQSYQKYAQYMEKKGDLISAINYYEMADDFEAVFAILEGNKRFEIMEQIPQLLDTFFRVKDNWREIYKHPMAGFSYIYMMIMSSNRNISERGKKFFRYIKKYYNEECEQTARNKELLGELLIIESLIQFNDLRAVNETLQRSWTLRNKKPSVIFAKKIYSYGVPETLFMYHRNPGTLKDTVEEEKEYSRNYMRLIYNVEGTLETLAEAEYALETGQAGKALKLAENALEKAKFREHTCVVLSSYFVILRSLIFFGRKEEFDATIDDCRNYMENISRTMLVMDYDQIIGYVYAITGQLDKIPVWLRERQFENCNQIVRDSRIGCIVYGMYLCRQEKWVRLSANAEEIEASYSGTRHVFAEIYSKIFQSIALWYQQDIATAKACLTEAIELAKPDQVKTPFMESAYKLLPVLQSIQEENSYAGELIVLCEKWLSGLKAFEHEKYEKAIFTPREQEIMELLIMGSRNSEISQKMNIAMVTVEKNLTNIYRKIGVSNRTSAIRWYTNAYKS